MIWAFGGYGTGWVATHFFFPFILGIPFNNLSYLGREENKMNKKLLSFFILGFPFCFLPCVMLWRSHLSF
jgi:sulfite exporter TauE/SafE